MDEMFEKRVRAAAVAAWWSVLIGAGFVTVQWILFLYATKTEPAWILAFWGSGTDWTFVRGVWIWMTAAFKFVLWIVAIIALWLTLWARRLRRQREDR